MTKVIFNPTYKRWNNWNRLRDNIIKTIMIYIKIIIKCKDGLDIIITITIMKMLHYYLTTTSHRILTTKPTIVTVVIRICHNRRRDMCLSIFANIIIINKIIRVGWIIMFMVIIMRVSNKNSNRKNSY